MLYTSLPLYAPPGYDGTQLLLPGQLGYDVVGQLYGKLHLTDDLAFTAGRYGLRHALSRAQRHPHDAQHLLRATR